MEPFRLLGADEPPAYRVEHAHGSSAFLLICDHAGARIPAKLNSLGLTPQDLERHIAWDLGAAQVASRLAARLDAFLILQTYSRLVIDCNRQPGSAQSIVPLSESTRIPGNASVSLPQAEAREREVFQPYHDRLRAELDRRAQEARETVLISVHSFTPVYHGEARPWHTGLLYHRDARMAAPLLRVLRREPQLVVGDNQPYAVSDETDYAIPVYGERRGLLHVGIELRQDLISDEAGQEAWAVRLAQALPAAVAEVSR